MDCFTDSLEDWYTFYCHYFISQVFDTVLKGWYSTNLNASFISNRPRSDYRPFYNDFTNWHFFNGPQFVDIKPPIQEERNKSMKSQFMFLDICYPNSQTPHLKKRTCSRVFRDPAWDVPRLTNSTPAGFFAPWSQLPEVFPACWSCEGRRRRERERCWCLWRGDQERERIRKKKIR